jgi:multicomponent Na+:H+ antiporter subunit B
MAQFIDVILLLFLAAVAVAAVRMRDLFGVAMLLGIFSFLSASLFVVLDAADVAMTEAAVGAGVSTILVLSTLAATGRTVRPRSGRWKLPLLVVVLTGSALVYGTLDMPRYGDPNAPIQVHPIAKHYIEVSPTETGIPNMVTPLLAFYRGFDTLGETGVVFTAGIGVLALIGRRRRRDGLPHEPGLGPDQVAERHVIVRVVGKLMIPLILLFACYVQAHGDYGPGGGFQAGVVFASGLMLYMLLFGIDAAERLVPPHVLQRLIAAGLLLYGGTGLVSLLQGGRFLDYRTLAHDPLHGIHYGVILIELGVGITVTAVISSIVFTFTGHLRRGAAPQEV